MGPRALRRAVMITVGVALLTTGGAFADSVRTDGDIVHPGLEGVVDLGAVAPGAVLHLQVGFELECAGFSHVNVDQSVVLTPAGNSVPPGGTVVYTGTTIDPPGAGWPLDGDLCGTPPDPIRAAVPAEVTLTAPLLPGEDYPYTLAWHRSLDPVAAGDSGAVGAGIGVTFTLDVVSNTPPTLSLPAAVTVEGDQPGGGTAAYTVGATDTEDAAAPTAVCTPAVGAFVPLGTTAVFCTATDSDGAQTTGSFPLTVVDTTAPVLVGMPGALTIATADPSGGVLAYSLPTATDAVDAAPSVTCTPAVGAIAPMGASTVTCTATDDSGNETSATFGVRVVGWSATWDEPIGSGASITANGGRTIPVKVRLVAGGAEVMTGEPVLWAARCDGLGDTVASPLTWSAGNGRWNGHLDTSLLPGTGCYRVSVMVGGLDLGAFSLDLVGSMTPAKASRAKAG